MTVAFLTLVIATSIIVGWLAYEVFRLKARVETVPEEGGVFEALRRLDVDLAQVEEVVEDLHPRFLEVERRLPTAVQHTAVVSYDAFGDVGGRLSRSIALLNQGGDGIVLSLLVGRQDTRFFTKEVRGGRGTEPLSPEESQAVARALSGTMPP